MHSCFYESKKYLACLLKRKEKKTEDGENVFVKALAKTFLLMAKRCSWPTFYQMDFMKR